MRESPRQRFLYTCVGRFCCWTSAFLLAGCSPQVPGVAKETGCGPRLGGRILVVQDVNGAPVPVRENTEQLKPGAQIIAPVEIGERVLMILEQNQAVLIEKTTCEQGWVPSTAVRRVE
jgi:hypothetical protein